MNSCSISKILEEGIDHDDKDHHANDIKTILTESLVTKLRDLKLKKDSL